MPRPLLCALLAALVLILPSVSSAGAKSGFGSGYKTPALMLSPAQFTGHVNANRIHAAQDQPLRLPGDSPRPLRLTADFELPGEPDRQGLRKDTFYFLFSQFFVIGILYVMPEDLSGWSDEQKDDFRLTKWRDNVREIVWDSDRWWINYILHPYWGGAYFVRATERGYGEDEAFWYSVLLSTIYEYGAEAMFETPSVQDLILTPGLGFFVGKYMMSLRNEIRAQLRAGHELTAGDRAILFVTDPLGSVNKAFDRMFGIRGDYTLSPFLVATSGQVAFHPDDSIEGPRTAGFDPIVPGLQLNLRW